MAAEWYFKVTGNEFGPVSVAELVQQAADGRIVPDTEVRKGDGAWVPASKVAGLFDRAAQARESAPTPPTLSLEPEGASVFVPSPRQPFFATASTGDFEVLDMAEGDGFKVEVL